MSPNTFSVNKKLAIKHARLLTKTRNIQAFLVGFSFMLYQVENRSKCSTL